MYVVYRETMENQTEVKIASSRAKISETEVVYYPMTSQMQEKADKFGVASRKKYITLENNPFGFKKGILFTGGGVREGLSKTRLNFMQLYGDLDEIGSDKWRELSRYIRTISNAIAYDTVVSAKGKLKGGEMFETQRDVETNDLGFDDFFYDEEKHQIYRFEITN